MFCSCDLPARAEVQNHMHVSGYKACPCCEHPGQLVRNENTKRSYVRYLAQTEPSRMRTHKDIVEIGYNIFKGNVPHDTKGLKGISCMIAFKNFDLVNGLKEHYHLLVIRRNPQKYQLYSRVAFIEVVTIEPNLFEVN